MSQEMVKEEFIPSVACHTTLYVFPVDWCNLQINSVCTECQMICIRSSWCHATTSSLASVKSRIVLPFWYRLTQFVLEKRPLNGSVFKQMIDNNYISIICLRDFSLILLYFFKFLEMAEWKIYSFLFCYWQWSTGTRDELVVHLKCMLYLLTVTLPLTCQNLALVIMSYNWRIQLFLQT